MAVTSADEFFAVLEKSDLLSEAQLVRARAVAGADDDPKTIAKRLAHQGVVTHWQAGQLLAGRSAFRLGKYQLIDLLGRGGMGKVFLGQHLTMNRRVALKVISREVSKDPAVLKRFLADARAIAALDHPNLVQAYSVDNEGDRYYLVMEYVEGIDLQRLIDDAGPLDCDRAVNYLGQAVNGLEHAHRRQMIHYGVRPSKLLVNLQGVLKIVDLGLAWLSEGGQLAAAMRDQQDWDAVDYLAPEQTLEGGTPDGRSDVYSLGCVLHFMLTGHPSFRQGTPSQRILAHQTCDLPDLHVEQSKIPPDLAAVCQRMVARNPTDRYQTLAEVRHALGRISHHV